MSTPVSILSVVDQVKFCNEIEKSHRLLQLFLQKRRFYAKCRKRLFKTDEGVNGKIVRMVFHTNR